MSMIVPGVPPIRSLLMLAGFIAVCLVVSALGGLATASSVGSWYQGLAKPPFNPPDWVFAPVWLTLYLMIAVSGWRVWRVAGFAAARGAFAWYAIQLALNLTWSLLFFGARAPGAALIEVIVLWIAIVATATAFWRFDRLAAVLLVPYAAWVGYAGLLNASIWWLNR